MRQRFTAWIGLAAVLAAAITSLARAADTSYLGQWKLDSAVIAPWADPKNPDPAEKNALIGKTITLAAGGIAGPKPFPCKKPVYKVSDFTADMLFEGAFGEMHDKDKKADPEKLAASLGFAGTSWKTLETGCEIDWHFVDPTTAKIGLDDFVYTSKKQ